MVHVTYYIQSLIKKVTATLLQTLLNVPIPATDSKQTGCFTQSITIRDHNYECCFDVYDLEWLFPYDHSLWKFILLSLLSNP